MRRYLGLDIGGTNIKSAIVEIGPDGVPIARETETFATRASRGPDAVVSRVGAIGRSITARCGPVDGVGVTVPGTFDQATGQARMIPNLPGAWNGVSVREPVHAALGVRTVLVNDARAFALAESVVGSARGLRTVVCLVLGTGVGGAVVIDGRLHLGANGLAGEIGHQVVAVDGPPCGCGNRGCVEALASASALSRLAGRENPEQVYAAAREGDVLALEAIDHVVRWLAIALANAYVLLAPDAIVVGGGVALAGDSLLAPLAAELRRCITVDDAAALQVLPAQLGHSAGAIGAALSAHTDQTGLGAGAASDSTEKTASITKRLAT